MQGRIAGVEEELMIRIAYTGLPLGEGLRELEGMSRGYVGRAAWGTCVCGTDGRCVCVGNAARGEEG